MITGLTWLFVGAVLALLCLPWATAAFVTRRSDDTTDDGPSDDHFEDLW